MKEHYGKHLKIFIHNVASEAGVYISTVSRVIRKYTNVAEETEIKLKQQSRN